MKTSTALLSLLFLMPFFAKSQSNLSGVLIEKVYMSSGLELQLNGAGIREKYFIDLYVAALYLEQKKSDSKEILEENKSFVLTISIVSDLISSSKMKESIEDGFMKSTQGIIEPYKDRISKFVEAISENIAKGVKYELVYHPEKNTTLVYKDKKFKVEIKGNDFRKVLLGIWLGTHPVDKQLKKDLLGI